MEHRAYYRANECCVRLIFTARRLNRSATALPMYTPTLLCIIDTIRWGTITVPAEDVMIAPVQ